MSFILAVLGYMMGTQDGRLDVILKGSLMLLGLAIIWWVGLELEKLWVVGTAAVFMMCVWAFVSVASTFYAMNVEYFPTSDHQSGAGTVTLIAWAGVFLLIMKRLHHDETAMKAAKKTVA